MIAIISDIHGNQDALSSVLEDIQKSDISNIWCLGDMVGYGAEPSQCVDLIFKNCRRVVLGNHDVLAINGCNLNFLPEHVSSGILHARRTLTQTQREWLLSLPYSFQDQEATAVHASLYKPDDFSYLASDEEAQSHFALQKTNISFVGHTHVPMMTLDTGTAIKWADSVESLIQLDKEIRYAVNVGSVGQPRDNNPKASYVTYNPLDYTIQFRRVQYDITNAQRKISNANLSEINSKRLGFGR
jgi:predicted phosphodiesterase